MEKRAGVMSSGWSMKLAMAAAVHSAIMPSLAIAQKETVETTSTTSEAQGINFFDFSNTHAYPLAALFFNFALLSFIAYFILRKPLGKRLRDRKEDLEKAIGEAREAKTRAEEAAFAARAKLAAIDMETARLREAILAAGEAESAKIEAAAATRARRLIEDTESMVGAEVARLADAIREEAVEKIVEEAVGLIRERIVDEDRRRLTAEYMDDLAEAMGDAPGKP